MDLVSVSFKRFVEGVLRLPQEVLDGLRLTARLFYCEPGWCDYSPFGMYLLGVARHCSSENLTRFYAGLCDHADEVCGLLGFTRLPPYSTVAHFFNTRIAGRVTELVDAGRQLLERTCKDLGQLRSMDGKVMASTHCEAEFNPHYKKTMYKGIVEWDLDLLVPLKSFIASGVADERPYSLQTHEQLKHLKTQLRVLDGGYYDFKHYCLNAVMPTLIYFPQETNASENPGEELQKSYRKHWQHGAYEVGATVTNQIKFLLSIQEHEPVGRYYRDLQVLESKNNPTEYYHKKHERSLVETCNSLLDNRGMANRVKHASKKQAERDLHWTCHALQIQKLTQL